MNWLNQNKIDSLVQNNNILTLGASEAEKCANKKKNVFWKWGQIDK